MSFCTPCYSCEDCPECMLSKEGYLTSQQSFQKAVTCSSTTGEDHSLATFTRGEHRGHPASSRGEPKAKASWSGSSLPRNVLIQEPKFSLCFRRPPQQPSYTLTIPAFLPEIEVQRTRSTRLRPYLNKRTRVARACPGAWILRLQT